MIKSGKILSNELLNNRLDAHIKDENAHKDFIDLLNNHTHDFTSKLEIDGTHLHSNLIQKAINLINIHNNSNNIHLKVINKIVSEIVNTLFKHINNPNSHSYVLDKFSMSETYDSIGTKKNRLIFTGAVLKYVK
ncbi:MAG: hypothetical protein QXX30_02225 [Candidatus Aenigmatarchaeota archaeon]